MESTTAQEVAIAKIQVELQYIRDNLEKVSVKLDALNNSLPSIRQNIDIANSKLYTLEVRIQDNEKDIDKNTKFREEAQWLIKYSKAILALLGSSGLINVLIIGKMIFDYLIHQ